MFPTAVPVPEPLILEEDPGELERPFSIMAEIAGCETSIPNFTMPPYAALREHIGTQKWSILGKLATMDPEQLGVTKFMDVPTRENCALRELDYWAGVITKRCAASATDRGRGDPLAAARTAAQAPNDSASCTATIGPATFSTTRPARSAAFSIGKWPTSAIRSKTSRGRSTRCGAGPNDISPARLLPRRRAIEIWQSASGIDVDPDAFRWWQVFASIKGSRDLDFVDRGFRQRHH